MKSIWIGSTFMQRFAAACNDDEDLPELVNEVNEPQLLDGIKVSRDKFCLFAETLGKPTLEFCQKVEEELKCGSPVTFFARVKLAQVSGYVTCHTKSRWGYAMYETIKSAQAQVGEWSKLKLSVKKGGSTVKAFTRIEPSFFEDVSKFFDGYHPGEEINGVSVFDLSPLSVISTTDLNFKESFYFKRTTVLDIPFFKTSAKDLAKLSSLLSSKPFDNIKIVNLSYSEAIAPDVRDALSLNGKRLLVFGDDSIEWKNFYDALHYTIRHYT